jgi:DNA-directed RNA polymerase specialized sigma24 family protein
LVAIILITAPQWRLAELNLDVRKSRKTYFKAMSELALPGRNMVERTHQTEPLRTPLSQDEMVAVISGITSAEKTTLMMIARNIAQKRRAMKYQYGDLVQEAFCRVLEGRRTWPQGLPAMVFLRGVMESIASEWRSEFVSEEIEHGDDGVAERGTIAKLEIKRIVAAFDDDPIAQKMIIAMMDGEKGAELQQSAGLDDLSYATKMKKIRRRLAKLNA